MKQKKKKCVECGKMFTQFRSTQKVCGYECSLTYLETKKKEKEMNLKNLNQAIEAKKERSKLPTALNTTKTVVHDYIHHRDIGKPCITCGTPYKEDFDAGHCYPTKFTLIRFDLDNIHLQCIRCNRFKDGEEAIYQLNLPNRIGQERFDSLQKKAKLSHIPKTWTRTELSEIRKNVRELKKKL